MKRIFLAALMATTLAFGCDDADDKNNGMNPLTGTAGETPPSVDACAAVRCAKGPCVVKDGKPVCTEAGGVGVGGGGAGGAAGPTGAGGSAGGGDACKGVTCPNQGSCHAEGATPVCTDACSAVRCANGPCVVKDGKAVCTGTSPPTTDACTGVVCPNQGRCHVEGNKPVCVDACAAVHCVNGTCAVVDGKAVCTPRSADAGAPDAALAPDTSPTGDACKVDGDCATHVDYCAAPCGVCVAISKTARPKACWPPANVFCINVCEGKKAICQAGACVVR
jgi:hypothetical protein